MEICVDNLDSVRNAVMGGAKRIELCSSLPEGGLTPTLGLLKGAKAIIGDSGVKIHVLIRPRAGDFLYSREELKVAIDDALLIANEGGVDGLVFGCLNEDGEVDVGNCQKFMCQVTLGAATPVSFTFHRAFDLAKDPYIAAEAIVRLGMTGILTSGQKPNALEGKDLLKELSVKHEGKIKILPGGGINEDNLLELASFLSPQITEFHSSAKELKQTKMKFLNQSCQMGTNSEDYSTYVSSATKIRAMVNMLKIKDESP